MNVPIGVAGFVFGALFLPEHREPGAGRFDIAGFVLAGVGFAALMYAVSEGPSRGWASPLIVALGLSGVTLLAALVWVELRSEQPMIPVRLLRNALFRTTTAVMVLGTMAFLGCLFLVSLFFQDGLGLTALNAGLSTFPEAIGVMAGAQVATRIYPRVGPRRVLVGGLVGVAATTALMTTVGFGTNLWIMRGFMLLLGLSMAHVFVSAQAAAFAQITLAAMGRASTLFNAGRQLGAAVGVAVLSTVATAVGLVTGAGAQTVPNLSAYHAAFFTASAIALAGAAVALLVDDRAAAATMHRRGSRDTGPDRGAAERVGVAAGEPHVSRA